MKSAYPSAVVDKSLVATFNVWFVRVPKSAGRGARARAAEAALTLCLNRSQRP